MTNEEALKRAKDWLISHGYKQWPDGTWGSEGYEAEADIVLSEYIKDKE